MRVPRGARHGTSSRARCGLIGRRAGTRARLGTHPVTFTWAVALLAVACVVTAPSLGAQLAEPVRVGDRTRLLVRGEKDPLVGRLAVRHGDTLVVDADLGVTERLGGPAHPVPPAGSVPHTLRVLMPGDRVRFRSGSPHRVVGRVIAASEDSLGLDRGGAPMRYPVAALRDVERDDGRTARAGTLRATKFGAVPGFVLGGLLGVMLANWDERVSTGQSVGAMLFVGGAGAAAGGHSRRRSVRRYRQTLGVARSSRPDQGGPINDSDPLIALIDP